MFVCGWCLFGFVCVCGRLGVGLGSVLYRFWGGFGLVLGRFGVGFGIQEHTQFTHHGRQKDEGGVPQNLRL